MKITLVTIRVPKQGYDEVAERWIASYKEFKPAIPHDLLVVNCESNHTPSVYDEVATDFMRYDGGGWDCGTWVHVGKRVETDLLVCCNTSTFFTRSGWMERFVEAAEQFGNGLYGPLASFECSRHIRTPCMVFQPEVMRDYPYVIDSRQETYTFECLGGEKTFTTWCKSRGLPVKLVTWDGVYDMEDWRKPPNIFRRGDQSNLLVRDRWCVTYENDTEEGKRVAENLADGL